MNETGQGVMVSVWDLFVRVFHWLLVAAFFVAYLTEDELMGVHVWAGYLAGLLVVLRVVWGIVGSRHARFADFIYRPRIVLDYLRDLVVGRSQRYVGHSPAGGAMIVALMLAIATTVGTGFVVYGAAEGSGPLAGLHEMPPPDAPVRYRGPIEGAFKEIHEVAANLTLVLIFLHVAGVVLASLAHRENLVRAMITGRKRA